MKQAWVAVLGLALAALLLLIWSFIRRRKQQRVERDSLTGLFRRYKETQFRHFPACSLEQDPSADRGRGVKKSKKEEKCYVAVLEFKGDLRAKQHETLAQLVDEVVLNRKRIVEVVLRVNAPGGTVPHYGHVYAELERLRRTEVKLTACVDVVAASGGYLACLPAERILAAPFAIVGSIGVMAFVPNVRGLLEAHHIKPRTFTSGNYKRTVTLTDDASPQEVEHFQTQLESIHEQFRQALSKYRPGVPLAEAANGDHWTAADSVERELGLVDELKTSYEYLLERNAELDVVYISQKRTVWEGGLGLLFSLLSRVLAFRQR